MYKLFPDGTALRLADGAFIPNDPDNIDRQDFQRWLASGYTPEPFEVEQTTSVPQSVTRFQAYAALLLTPSTYDGFDNMLDEVNSFMSADGVDLLAKLAWEQAQEFRRNSPTIQAFAAQLELTDQDLDELFILAAGIDA